MAATELQVPIIDLSHLKKDATAKSLLIKQIHEACTNPGIFHVINHGIPENVIEEAMDANRSFFELALEKKVKYDTRSDELVKPVRFRQDHGGNLGISRELLKLYTYPPELYISLWPEDPPEYREKMGRLAMEMRKLGISIMEPILETLNLDTTYLKQKHIKQGVHTVAINNYPPTSPGSLNGSNTITRMVPHTDHGFATMLIQSLPGLQVMNRETGKYETVPTLKGSIQILVADHLEVMSNGKYKSAWHRVVHTSGESRLSMAGSLSLGMDQVVEPADALVDEGHPRKYRGYSLRDYLNHLNSGIPKSFIETLKL